MSEPLPPNIAPRGLTMRQAAAYWGVSYNTFRKLVREGYAPAPVDIGLGRMIFDRVAMDRAMDAASAVPEAADLADEL